MKSISITLKARLAFTALMLSITKNRTMRQGMRIALTLDLVLMTMLANAQAGNGAGALAQRQQPFVAMLPQRKRLYWPWGLLSV